MPLPTPHLKPRTCAEWRRWLARHHVKAREVWLLLAKKALQARQPNWPSYDDALDEALCFGWIDGKVVGGGGDFRVIRFTPRRADSIWSPRNKAKVARLEREGRVQPAGRAAVEAGKRAGTWKRASHPSMAPAAQWKSGRLPKALADAFKSHDDACAYFKALAPSHQKQWLYWLGDAKKPETRARRAAAVVKECAARRKPGLTTPATR